MRNDRRDGKSGVGKIMTLTMRFIRQLAVVSIAMLVLSGCARERPIYEVENQPIPQLTPPLSPAQVEARIIEAGKRDNWRIRSIGPGHLEGLTRWSRHSATVAIDYSAKAYSIRYKSSVQLLEGIAPQDHWYAGKRVIHKTYNRRVRELKSAIDNELSHPNF